jgi:hypothetical protein
LATARQRLQESTGAEKKDALTELRSTSDELRVVIRKAIQVAQSEIKNRND